MNADYQDFRHKEQTIIKVFYRAYNKLGYGFLEKIYENAMMIEFRIEVGLLLNFVPKPELTCPPSLSLRRGGRERKGI